MHNISYNDIVLGTKKMVLNKEEFFEKIEVEEMLVFIEEHFEEHGNRDGTHYCKNIKIYNLGIDENLEDKFFNQNLMSAVWDVIIIPKIGSWKNKHGSEIYQKGRSGGWLYCDRAKVLDLSEYAEKYDYETDDEYDDRIYELRGLFETLWNFEKWYQKTFDEVIAYLKGVKMDEDKEET